MFTKREVNLKERTELVKAMDLIARSLNDEVEICSWWTSGVEDHDENFDDLDYQWYAETNERFADLMDTFVWLMRKGADRKGKLYCDGVCSGCCE